MYNFACLITYMATMRKSEVISDITKVYVTLRKQFIYTNKIIRSLKIDMWK